MLGFIHLFNQFLKNVQLLYVHGSSVSFLLFPVIKHLNESDHWQGKDFLRVPSFDHFVQSTWLSTPPCQLTQPQHRCSHIAPISSEPWGDVSRLWALPHHFWAAISSHFLREGYTSIWCWPFFSKLFISYCFDLINSFFLSISSLTKCDRSPFKLIIFFVIPIWSKRKEHVTKINTKTWNYGKHCQTHHVRNCKHPLKVLFISRFLFSKLSIYLEI